MNPSHRSDFYVLSVVSNPVRYQSRYKLYSQYSNHIRSFGLNLMTIEMAFGDRPFAVTESHNPLHLQVRTWDELWHKENLLNLGIAKLKREFPNFQYVAWVDADVEFVNKDWVNETIHQLQHHKIVQLFSHAIDLGPSGEALQTHHGFGYSHLMGKEMVKGYGSFWHPGYGWAMRREVVEAMGNAGGMGPLLDRALLGAGDHHMALALLGEARRSQPGGLHPNYYEMVNHWQEASQRHVGRDIGFVRGTLLHHWHGKKKDRRYVERWGILQKHQYDPNRDVILDHQGLYHLHPSLIHFRDDLRRYFRQRNEDSSDHE